MKASEWIDRVKKQHGWDSDYRAAKELGLSRNTISNYRGGIRQTFDEDVAIKVAHALKVPVESVLVDQVMERTKDSEARSAWQRVLQGLSGVAAGLLVACGLIGTPTPSHASTASITAPLYIMSNRWRYIFGSFSIKFNVG